MLAAIVSPPVSTFTGTVSAPSRQQDDTSGSRLLGWLASEGATVSPHLQVVDTPPLGRELAVTSPVESGEVLICLTPELCIPAPQPEPSSSSGEPLPEDVRLAATLLQEQGSERWQAYCAALPSPGDLEERLPVFWDDRRLQSMEAQFPSLRAQVESRRRLLRDAAARLGAPLDALTQAHALVSTRAVGAKIDACAMIPGVDMANHSPEPNTELVAAGAPGVRTGRATLTPYGEVWEHGTAGLVALRDLAAGEVVRISYGGYPNQRLILDYGFSLGASNPSGDLEKEGSDGEPQSPAGWARKD